MSQDEVARRSHLARAQDPGDELARLQDLASRLRVHEPGLREKLELRSWAGCRLARQLVGQVDLRTERLWLHWIQSRTWEIPPHAGQADCNRLRLAASMATGQRGAPEFFNECMPDHSDCEVPTCKAGQIEFSVSYERWVGVALATTLAWETFQASGCACGQVVCVCAMAIFAAKLWLMCPIKQFEGYARIALNVPTYRDWVDCLRTLVAHSPFLWQDLIRGINDVQRREGLAFVLDFSMVTIQEVVRV